MKRVIPFFLLLLVSLSFFAQKYSYAKRFADSEMKRFPQAWQLDHGKRLYFGYSQGVGGCAMLALWKPSGDKNISIM